MNILYILHIRVTLLPSIQNLILWPSVLRFASFRYLFATALLIYGACSLLILLDHRWLVNVAVSTDGHSTARPVNDVKWPFGKFPTWKASPILWDSHIIQTSFNFIIFILSSASTFQSFWICIFIDIMLIIKLRLWVSTNTLITKLWDHAHVILGVDLEIWIGQHVLWDHRRICIWRYYHALNDVLSGHHKWIISQFTSTVHLGYLRHILTIINYTLHVNVKIIFRSTWPIWVSYLLIKRLPLPVHQRTSNTTNSSKPLARLNALFDRVIHRWCNSR